MKRRDFFRTASLFALAPLVGQKPFEPLWASDSDAPETTPFAAFSKLGFNPKSPNCVFFAVTADIHYGRRLDEPNPEAFRTLLCELNAFPDDARPAFLAVLGDCGCSMSPSFGAAPNFAAADQEYANLKNDIKEYCTSIPVHLLAGNHDTPPGDSISEHFCAAFGTDPWYAFDCGGIRFLALDGGQDAFPCEKQKEWMEAQISQIPTDAPLVLMLHQPLSWSNERGFAECLPTLLANRTADVFLLAGHEHCDNERVFALPNARLVEITHISCAGGWAKTGTSYWLYCVSNGQIVGRIQRRSDGTYAAQRPFNPEKKPLRIQQPFDQTSGRLVVRALLGEDETVEILAGKGGNCGTFWFYVTELCAKLTFSDSESTSPDAESISPSENQTRSTSNPHRKLVILGNLNSRLNREPKSGETTKRFVTLSAPGVAPQTFSPGPNLPGNTHEIALPTEFQTVKELTIEIHSLGFLANDTLAGFAIFEE